MRRKSVDLDMGRFYEVSFVVEGYLSSGSSDVRYPIALTSSRRLGRYFACAARCCRWRSEDPLTAHDTFINQGPCLSVKTWKALRSMSWLMRGRWNAERN
jgi:hypothetical protein